MGRWRPAVASLCAFSIFLFTLAEPADAARGAQAAVSEPSVAPVRRALGLLDAAYVPAVLGTLAGRGPTAPPGADLWLDLALFDGMRLTDKMLDWVRDEVEAVFDGLDVRVGWVDRIEEPQRPVRTAELRVVILAVSPAAWGLGKSVMGTVLGNGAGSQSVYVFFPAVAGALQRFGGPHRFGRLGTESLDVGRALGRVIVHEVIHLLTPGRPHAPSGLMRQHLDRSDLTADEANVDDGFRQALRLGLATAIEQARRGIVAAGS